MSRLMKSIFQNLRAALDAMSQTPRRPAAHSIEAAIKQYNMHAAATLKDGNVKPLSMNAVHFQDMQTGKYTPVSEEEYERLMSMPSTHQILAPYA